MLGEILSPQTCAQCRLCCGFDNTDLWELPVLSDETVQRIQETRISPKLIPAGIEQTFSPPALQDGELFLCPMLCETGCVMGEKKPFDCSIWPFRMMRDIDGAVHITAASYCPGIQVYPDEKLCDFLEKGLGKKILDYAEAHPSHVKPMSEHYRIIW